MAFASHDGRGRPAARMLLELFQGNIKAQPALVIESGSCRAPRDGKEGRKPRGH